MMKTDMTAPDAPSMIFRVVSVIVSSPNVVSIVDSSVSMDTTADARLIDLDAEYTGLLYLRYLTVLIMASVSEVRVYAAMAIVVIS